MYIEWIYLWTHFNSSLMLIFPLGNESITIDNQEVLQTRFEPTAKMSTYLLAFVVGEFKNISSPPEANILVEIKIYSLSCSLLSSYKCILNVDKLKMY